jgi:hypothetical protein
MGRERRTVTIHYSMSRHFSPRDLRDNALAAQWLQALQQLCEDEQYESLSLMVEDMDSAEFNREMTFYTKARNALSAHLQGEELDQAIYDLWQVAW